MGAITKASKDKEKTMIQLVEGMDTLVKQTEGGVIQAFRARVVLSDKKDELFWMAGYDENKQWNTRLKGIPTAAGYNRINQVVGITFHQPEIQKMDNGSMVPNPFISRDKQGIQYVRIRLLGFGRLPTGNLTICDQTLYYDLRTYFAQDLMSKWTGKKSDNVKAWGRLTPSGADAPEGVDPASWNPVEIPGGLTLWVDLSNKDVVALYAEHISRQKFAERNARTIVQRNIIKAITGITRLDEHRLDGSNPESPKVYSVQVTGWVQADSTIREVEARVNDIHEGTMEIDGQVIEVHQTTETPDKAEIDEALVGDADEEMLPPEEPDGPPSVAPARSSRPAKPVQPDLPIDSAVPPIPTEPDSLTAARNEAARLWRCVGSIKAQGCLGGTGIKSLQALNTCTNPKIIQQVIETLRRNGAV